MKTEILNTQEAPVKWWAARDAQQRNIANASHHDLNDKIKADRMKLVLDDLYYSKKIYIAYGKKGISIKIDGARVINDKSLSLMEQQWDLEGIIKKVSSQGIIYKIKTA